MIAVIVVIVVIAVIAVIAVIVEFVVIVVHSKQKSKVYYSVTRSPIELSWTTKNQRCSNTVNHDEMNLPKEGEPR